MKTIVLFSFFVVGTLVSGSALPEKQQGEQAVLHQDIQSEQPQGAQGEQKQQEHSIRSEPAVAALHQDHHEHSAHSEHEHGHSHEHTHDHAHETPHHEQSHEKRFTGASESQPAAFEQTKSEIHRDARFVPF